jgi:hypothetical protein
MNKVPQSIEAEAAVIGGLLIDNSKWSSIAASLDVMDFHSNQHRVIFSAMKQSAAKNIPFDIITLPEQLKQMGKLGQVGCEGDIIEIANNTPSVANIHVYANIIKEKSLERTELKMLGEMCDYINQGNKDSQVYLQRMLAELKNLSLHNQVDSGYKPIDLNNFLGLKIPERRCIMSPWLPEQGLAMIYAPRGVGKTFLALNVAYSIASGTPFLNWDVPVPKKVLYIDGEMPAKSMQERLAAIEKSRGICVTDMLSILTPDLQKLSMPDLGTFDGQEGLDAALHGVEVIIVDNISTLCRNGKENDAEGWMVIQEWALRMRTQGKSVVFIHHAGKDGGQRGTSKREDTLDTSICLKRPVGYEPKDGATFELHFMKSRGFFGEEADPMLVELSVLDDERFQWECQPLEASTYKKVIALFREGLSQKEIALELEVNKSTVSRHLKNAHAEGAI